MNLPGVSHAQRHWRAVGLGVLAVAVGAVALPLGASASATSSTPTSAWSSNLLAGVRGTFDGSIGGWSTATSTAAVAPTGTPTQAGSGSLSLNNPHGPTGTLVAVSGNATSTWTKATPGYRYSGAAWVRAAGTARAARASVAFLDSSGNQLDHADAQWVTDSSSAWAHLVPAVGIAPPKTAYAVLKVMFAGVSAGEKHYTDSASLISAHGGSAAVAGPLHVTGNRIIGANGTQVVLRGVNREGLEGGGGDAPTQDDIAHAKAWGANFIRLPLNEPYWVAGSCYYQKGYAAKVDAAVNLVTGMGMVALVDLHFNAISFCGRDGQQPMADAHNAIPFWKQVAARYKSNPLVAFDLYNEPHDISDAIWRSGGSVKWKGVVYQAAGMQQMYNAVRSTGATNLVFVTAPSWGNIWPKSGPISGNNIVYAVHAYTCPGEAPPNCSNGAPYDPSQFFHWWVTPGKSYPVVVTEFGWPNPNDGGYIQNVINYAEAQGWGWSVFTWGDATWGQFDLLANAGPGASYEPKPTGMPALAAFPGN